MKDIIDRIDEMKFQNEKLLEWKMYHRGMPFSLRKY